MLGSANAARPNSRKTALHRNLRPSVNPTLRKFQAWQASNVDPKLLKAKAAKEGSRRRLSEDHLRQRPRKRRRLGNHRREQNSMRSPNQNLMTALEGYRMMRAQKTTMTWTKRRKLLDVERHRKLQQRRMDPRRHRSLPTAQMSPQKVASNFSLMSPPNEQELMVSRKFFKRIPRKAKSSRPRTKSLQAKCRLHSSLQRALGTTTPEVTRTTGGAKRTRCRALRHHYEQSQRFRLQTRFSQGNPDGSKVRQPRTTQGNCKGAEGRLPDFG